MLSIVIDAALLVANMTCSVIPSNHMRFMNVIASMVIGCSLYRSVKRYRGDK